MVIEKTRPAKVIIELVIAESTSRAPSGPAPNVKRPRPSWSARSSRTSPRARTTATSTHSVGSAQKPMRSDSRSAASRRLTAANRHADGS